MEKFVIISIIYITIMYFNYTKMKNDKKEMLRFKDSIARFTFIQCSFGVYELIQGRFDLSAFMYRVMFSHLGIASFNLAKDYLK
jgi:hypothetical protein